MSISPRFPAPHFTPRLPTWPCQALISNNSRKFRIFFSINISLSGLWGIARIYLQFSPKSPQISFTSFLHLQICRTQLRQFGAAYMRLVSRNIWRVLRGHNTYRHCLHYLLSVLKNALTNCPLIPPSSLNGHLRLLLEVLHGGGQGDIGWIGNIKIA